MSAINKIAANLQTHEGTRVIHLLVLFVALVLAYPVCKVFYNLFLHPLRRFPGPKLWAATRIPYTIQTTRGNAGRKMLEFHLKYGDIIRVAPNELSFQHPDAWKDIFGHRKAGQRENGKEPIFSSPVRDNIVGANRENHSRFRSALSAGFSAKAMADQQPLIKGYVDLLIQRLKEHSTSGQPLDMVSWYNWTTFDIIGDLSFGESFGCLEKAEMHPWITVIFDSIKVLSFIAEAGHYPPLTKVLQWMVPKEMARKNIMREELTNANVKKRLALETERPDIIGAMMAKKGEKAILPQELPKNIDVLIIAGSETTATCLSGVTYYLGCNPRVKEKLFAEIQSSFSSEDEINIHSVQNLSYMLAVLDETLRLYPPAPSALPRITPEGGAEICGQYIPGGTILDLWQWTMYHNPKNFAMTEAFIPERWLDDARFANDNREVLQPFSYGPRNCIGRNLAYTEMRLILARIMWNFDFELAEGAKDWPERQTMFGLWDKCPLPIYLKPRQKE